MAKSDRVKEELAESRHNDVMGLTLGAFGFAGVSLAIAYGMWQGWLEFIPMIVIIAIGYFWIDCVARRNRQRRSDLIQRLDK